MQRVLLDTGTHPVAAWAGDSRGREGSREGELGLQGTMQMWMGKVSSG